MKRTYYQKPGVNDCFPLADGEALFTVEKISADDSGQKEMAVGSRVPVCLLHLALFSMDFLESMRVAVQLDVQLRQWNLDFMEDRLRLAMEGEMGIAALD